MSVIIPTHKRPKSLTKAIKSSLQSSIQGSVEVLVIPNGCDEEWKKVAKLFTDDNRVSWLPIKPANVSLARNRGLAAAQGRYIRFLDDDDFFYAETCQKQLSIALAMDADICSGAIAVVDYNEQIIQVKQQPITKDICSAALGPSRLIQVGAHIFKRELAQQVQWNPNHSIAEDVQWFIDTITIKELHWLKIKEPVSAWVQHREARLSSGHDPGRQVLLFFSKILLSAGNRLDSAERLNDERRTALSDGLWSLLQKGLRYDYSYWHNIAKIANAYTPNRCPPSAIYRYSFIQKINPLIIESLLIPIRWAYYPLQSILDRLNINRH